MARKGRPLLNATEDRIRAQRNRLLRILLDKAMAGDVQAIQACLDLSGGDDPECMDEGPPHGAANDRQVLAA